MNLRLFKYILPTTIMLLVGMPNEGYTYSVVPKNNVEWVWRGATAANPSFFASPSVNSERRQFIPDRLGLLHDPSRVLADQAYVFAHHSNHPKDWLRKCYLLPHSDTPMG